MVIIIDQALKKLQEMIKTSLYFRDKRSPTPKNETVSRVMSANKAKNTGPEVKLRKKLREIGLIDYKLHSPKITGKPDIAFNKKKLAVFVNGCFWHGHSVFLG